MSVPYATSAECSNNEVLADLVNAARVSTAVALTLFNRGRPPAQAYTERAWRSFFIAPESPGWRAVADEELQRAEMVFAPLSIERSQREDEIYMAA